jgi:type IV pilus assembly protein PilE
MCRTAHRSMGFTIIEVLVAVAIVGILAAIALPAYQDSVTRGKLIDGTMRLGDYRAQMEKWFLDNRDFRSNPPAGAACGIPAPVPAASDPFALTSTCTPTTYLLTATGQASYGMSGFSMTVNQSNQRTSSGPLGKWTNATCWATRKDGSCQ